MEVEIKDMLEVGDRIYEIYNDRFKRIYTIERVTKTLAICGETKFKRNSRSFIKKQGSNTWSASFYELENEDLKRGFKKELMISKMSKIDFRKLDNETLSKILKLLK